VTPTEQTANPATTLSTGFFAPLSSLLRVRGSGAFSSLLLPALVLVFFAFTATSALAAGPPETPETGEANPAITATTATLEGGVLNPGAAGEVGEYEYRFRVSETECEGESGTSPEVALGAAKETVPAVHLTNLQPNEEYSFCLVERNLAHESSQLSPVKHFTTPPAAPAIESEGVSSIKATEAHLEGVVNPNNQTTECRFQYGTEPSLATGTTTALCEPASFPASLGGQSIGLNISGLIQDTTYYYRVLAKNATGETKGTEVEPIMHFETALPPNTPEKATATNLTATTATLNGVLNPGGARTKEAGSDEFFYQQSPSECRGENERAVGASNAPGLAANEPAEAPVTELLPGATYTYCLLVRNEAGEETLGPPETFTAHAAAPVIANETASAVSATAATLEAQIDPNGAETTYHFEYDTTPYTSSAPHGTSVTETKEAEISIGQGTSTVSVKVQLKGLTPATTYYYRAVASNSLSPAGGTLGPDRTLATPALANSTLTGDANEASCPNEALSGFSTGLPDCRAYELVSAVDNKFGGEVGSYPPAGYEDKQTVQTSPEGDGATFTSTQAFADAQGSDALNTYLAARGAGGWSVRSISPPKEPTLHNFIESGLTNPFLAFSSDLSAAVLVQGDPALVPGAPPLAFSLYRRDNVNNSYQLLTSGAAAPVAGSASPKLPMGSFQGASPDFSHIVFEPPNQEGGEAPGKELYEWANGQLSLVSILPNGETAPEGSAGDCAGKGVEQVANVENAVSSDGSRVFWTNARCPREPGVGNLYVREHGEREAGAFGSKGECSQPEKACTVQVNVSQRSPSLGDGNAYFMGATPDGAKVLFTDQTALTSGSGDQGGGLYQFDVGSGVLSDLTPDSAGPAEVMGVLGQSADGGTVYFVAKSVLTSAASSRGLLAQPGAENLYVVRGGAIAFIATLSGEDGGEGGPYDHSVEKTQRIGDWSYSPSYRTARVTPDGSGVAFMSVASLTGYDNTVASGTSCGVDPYAFGYVNGTELPNLSGPACAEVFLYDAAANQLKCASCNPSGARPVGNSSIPTWNNRQAFDRWPASVYQPRYLSPDGGRLFFNSSDAILPHDTNGQQDVYEYEGEKVYLISSGTSPSESAFADASADGSNVFFTTRSQLLAQDMDGGEDLYDARVGGGFAVAGAGAPSCLGDACWGVSGVAAPLPFIASSVFSGSGNVAPVAVVKHKTVKKTKHKTVKRKAKHKGKARKSRAGRRARVGRSVGKANAMRKGAR
jgi:hypothetical protein